MLLVRGFEDGDLQIIKTSGERDVRWTFLGGMRSFEHCSEESTMEFAAERDGRGSGSKSRQDKGGCRGKGVGCLKEGVGEQEGKPGEEKARRGGWCFER